MNKLSHQYVKNMKALFPISRKQERDYLKKLEMNIEDYCEENSISSLEELYKEFGSPTEAVSTYFSTLDIDYLLKKINRTKIIKYSLIALVAAAFVAAFAYCMLLYSEHQVILEEQIFSEETYIE